MTTTHLKVGHSHSTVEVVSDMSTVHDLPENVAQLLPWCTAASTAAHRRHGCLPVTLKDVGAYAEVTRGKPIRSRPPQLAEAATTQH